MSAPYSTAARPWIPEHPVDRDLATRLVRAQFPDLPDADVTHVGSGWDTDVWRFGDLAFRFPRRAFGVYCVEVEARVLPGIAPHLDQPIPAATHLGAPTEDFGYPFLGHPFLPGTPADVARPDDAHRGRLAPQLGRFLRQLHSLPLALLESLEVPPDPGRGDLQRMATQARRRSGQLDGTRWQPLAEAAIAGLADVPPDGPPTGLAHGDFYSRHLLLDDAPGDLCGVIDWGDVCMGDPAVDLGIAYGFLPAPARPAFFEAYGEVDDATRARARTFAIAHAVQLLVYAADVGEDRLADEAAYAVTAALTP